MLATGGRDGTIRLWKAGTGELIATAPVCPSRSPIWPSPPTALPCSRPTPRATSGTSTPRPGKPAAGFEVPFLADRWTNRYLFGPDRSSILRTGLVARLARAGPPAIAQRLDVAAKRPDGPPFPLVRAGAITFRPDGRAVLNLGQLWEVASGRLIGEACLSAPAMQPTFTADGKAMLILGVDGRARLWDAIAGRPIGGPLGPPSDGDPPGGWASMLAVLSPDGRFVAARGRHGTVQLYEAATARPIGPVLSFDDRTAARPSSPWPRPSSHGPRPRCRPRQP